MKKISSTQTPAQVSPNGCGTLWNRPKIGRLACQYHAKAWLYKDKMDKAYQELTGISAWDRAQRYETFGYESRARAIVPEEEAAWLRYEHDYYRHLALDALEIAFQLRISLLAFRLSQFIGSPGQLLTQGFKLLYPYDPACLLMREQAHLRLHRLLTVSEKECAITTCVAAAMDEAAHLHRSKKRPRRKECRTCFRAGEKTSCEVGRSLFLQMGQAKEEALARLARLPEAEGMTEEEISTLSRTCAAVITTAGDWLMHKCGTHAYVI